KFVLKRLEMDVAGAVLNGLEKDEVDEPDDGRGIRHARNIIGRPRGGGFSSFAREVAIGPQFFEDIGHAALGVAIVAVDGFFDVARIGDNGNDVAVDEKANLVNGGGVERIGEGQLQRAIVGVYRHALVHARGVGWHSGEELGGKLAVVQGDDFRAQMISHKLELSFGVNQTEVVEDFADGFAGAIVLLLDLLQLQIVEEILAANQV